MWKWIFYYYGGNHQIYCQNVAWQTIFPVGKKRSFLPDNTFGGFAGRPAGLYTAFYLLFIQPTCKHGMNFILSSSLRWIACMLRFWVNCLRKIGAVDTSRQYFGFIVQSLSLNLTVYRHSISRSSVSKSLDTQVSTSSRAKVCSCSSYWQHFWHVPWFRAVYYIRRGSAVAVLLLL